MKLKGSRFTIFLFVLILLVLTTGCQLGNQEFMEEKDFLGTYAKIIIFSDDAVKAGRAMDEAFKEIIRLDNLLSEYKNNTPVSKLNSQGFIDDPPDELVFLLEKSVYYFDISNGSFDITVKPVLDLYTESFSVKGVAPTDEEVQKTLELVNSSKIKVSNEQVSLQSGMSITLGAIGKGYIIDLVIAVLEGLDVENVMVDIGGDLRTIGVNPRNKDWVVALQNPRDDNDFITIINGSGKSIATSGDYERYFVENKSIHHIVDPKTGYSATDLISVTVAASTALEADALATSVFVMGPKKGLLLIENMKGAEALLITRDKQVLRSSGFRELELK